MPKHGHAKRPQTYDPLKSEGVHRPAGGAPAPARQRNNDPRDRSNDGLAKTLGRRR